MIFSETWRFLYLYWTGDFRSPIHFRSPPNHQSSFKKSLLSLFLLLLCTHLNAQVSFPNIHIVGLSNLSQVEEIKSRITSLNDTSRIEDLLSVISREMVDKGYLEFGVETINKSEEQWEIAFHQGRVYVYNVIETIGLSDLYRRKFGIDRLTKKSFVVNWEALENRLTLCLQQFQDDGHPFASFELEDIAYQSYGSDTLGTHITYRFDAGALVTIDSIHIGGNHREKDEFVQALGRLSLGMRYNQAMINDLPRVLNNSIYYEQVEAPKVTFSSPEEASLSLKLKRRRAGKFDVLLGILPPDNNNQTLQFTGSADIVLVSPLRYGEVIRLQYDKFTQTSQRLDLNVTIPYLLRTPLRLEGGLFLHKQNEDFLNRIFSAAAWYNFSANLSARFYIQNRRSSFLGGDGSLQDSSLLIQQIDGQKSVVGLGINYEKLDYRITPTKGLKASLSFALGNRALRDNPRIPEDLYQGLASEQRVQELNLDIKWYRPIVGRHIFHLANRTYWLGQQDYFINDLLQVGGAKSIRGFNENEFFTNFYSFFTAAYHLMLEKDSYIFIFGDYAYLQNSVSQEHLRPRAFGLGMRYGTKAGIISISYAVGSLGSGNIQPGRGKIHIGLINQF